MRGLPYELIPEISGVGMSSSRVAVYVGQALAAYGFGEGHPFGPDRMDAFWKRMQDTGLDQCVRVCQPVSAREQEILSFHTRDYLRRVKLQSQTGVGYLDAGDTPAFTGMLEAASVVVGTVLDALNRIMSGEFSQAFVPIAGLHHARRDDAAGFCIFNDCGIAIETLRDRYAVERIAYVDIDAHHGDGVFYAFEDDPDVTIVDLHEDGRFLYPGTGSARESGVGEAKGTKLNIPMPPEASDQTFFKVWQIAERFLDKAKPQFVILQCGADSLAGDPITHLCYSEKVHRHVAERLKILADRHCDGKLLALGGGGYNRDNLARAWTAVVEAMLGESG
jgi:acetoin utilization protein AcuC